MSSRRISLGREGEELAGKHLQKLGYRIVCRNYRRRQGEIDIVANDGDVLVFVEVKTRSGKAFGDPLEAVTAQKQRQIAKTAMQYMAENDCFDCAARFDVVGVLMGDDGTSSLQLVREAFILNMES